MELYTVQQLKIHPKNCVYQESIYTSNGTHIEIFHKVSSSQKDRNSVEKHVIKFIIPSELIISSNSSIKNEASFVKFSAYKKSVYKYLKKKNFPTLNESQYSGFKSCLKNIIRKIMEILTNREISNSDLIYKTEAWEHRIGMHPKFSIYITTTTRVVQISLKEEVLKFVITSRMENKVRNIMRPYFTSLTILRWQILPEYSLIAIPLPECCLIRIPIEPLPIDLNGTLLILEKSRTKYINLKQFLSKISRYQNTSQFGNAGLILNKILTLNNNNLSSISAKDEFLTYRKLNTDENDKKQLISSIEKANSEPLNSKKLSNNQTSSNICNQHYNDLMSKVSSVENMNCSVIKSNNVNINKFNLIAIKDNLITNENQDDHKQISNKESKISNSESDKEELILIYSRDHKKKKLSWFDRRKHDISTTGDEPSSSESNFDRVSVKTSASSERYVDFKQIIMSETQNLEQKTLYMSDNFNQMSTKQLKCSNIYVDNRRLVLNYSNNVQVKMDRLGRSDSNMALQTFWTTSEQSTSQMGSSDQISSLEHCISYNFIDEEEFTEIPVEVNALNNAIIISCMFVLVIFLGLF